MSSAAIEPRYTAEEYLALERKAEYKSEYVNGHIIAMSGASRQHNLIAGNIYREISIQLRGHPCESYINDMRVRVSETGLYTYPDVVAVCGDIRFADGQTDTLLDPTVIVEVLSSEAYDRGDKFEHRRIELLKEGSFLSFFQKFDDFSGGKRFKVCDFFGEIVGSSNAVEMIFENNVSEYS